GLETDRDLETTIIISLFTDALAHPDDVIPDGSDDRRGWWGDTGAVGDQDAPPEGPLGSRLWLLSREKATESTRQRAQQYAAQALAWMPMDGVAARVDVKAEWLDPVGFPPGYLGLTIRILRGDGTVYNARYAWAWEQLFLPNVPQIGAQPPRLPAIWNVARW